MTDLSASLRSPPIASRSLKPLPHRLDWEAHSMADLSVNLTATAAERGARVQAVNASPAR